MMNGPLEFSAQGARVLAIDARDQEALFALKNSRCNADDLFRRLARTKDDFWKTFAQRPVHIHLRESEVRQRRGLKRAQNAVAADFSGSKFFQQIGGFRRGHERRVPELSSIRISNRTDTSSRVIVMLMVSEKTVPVF